MFPLNAILTPAITMTINASPGQHARPKGHYLAARRCRKTVKRGLNEGLEIPYFLPGGDWRGYSDQSEAALTTPTGRFRRRAPGL